MKPMLLLALLATTSAAQAQAPTRQPLAVIPIAPGKHVDRVETSRVDFAP